MGAGRGNPEGVLSPGAPPRLAALADEAFRAGAAALARGDAGAATPLLELAARAVPAGRPRAAAKVQVMREECRQI